MPELDGQVGLVTGGGRGIGADVARELASSGMRVAVSARTRDQVEAVAAEIGGLAIEGDVSRAEDGERMVAETERELGPIDLLVANAGIGMREERAWEMAPEDWWQVLEVNVLCVYLSCRAVIPSMLERARGRIVITGSFPDDLPWTPPECAPRLVLALASGRFDRLSGRYLHAEHDPPESLEGRIDEILADDLNAIRLRRA